MAVLKNKTQGNYTIVSQNIMRDRNLSLAERGMLITLLSLPDNWHLTLKGLSEILPDGRDKVANTLNSLIDKGYVTRVQSRGERGKFDSTDLEVHETPVVATDPIPEHEDIMENSPCTEKPYTVNPNTEKPDTENPTQYSIYKSNNNISNIHRVCSADTLTDAEYDDLVSEFGKAEVDYQINRIKVKGYKGCNNIETIRKWCRERLDRVSDKASFKPKKNSFFDFQQRSNIDFDALRANIFAN